RDKLADDGHTRQNHNVNSRMGVEPEEVLEQYRIATDLRIENTDVKDPLEHQENQRDPQDWGRKNLNDGGCVDTPHEQRHFEPTHPGSAQFMDGRDKVDACENRGEAENKYGRDHEHNRAVRGGAIRRVESPSGVDRADDHGRNRED